MWQCGPVKKIVARLSIALVVAAYIQPVTQGPAMAQANIGYNNVVSSRVSKTRGSVTLYTENSRELPRPIIRFLPGEYGDTILVADFVGIVWKPATRVIEVNSSFANRFATTVGVRKKGIKLVRIGRFQDSPPIMRVAIISNDAKKLKTVSFNSKPGKLTISWSKWLKSENTIRKAPDHKMAQRKGQNVPPFAPPIGAIDPHTVSNAEKVSLRPPIGMEAPPAQSINQNAQKKKGLFSRLIDKVKIKRAPKPAPQTAQKSKFRPASQSDIDAAKKQDETQRKTPSIVATKLGTDSYLVKIENLSTKSPKFKSFQLSKPDRFVIDFENMKELAGAQVPVISDNASLKSLRVGNPKIGDIDSTGRLVLDLKNPTIGVERKENGDAYSIAFLVGKSTNILNGLRAPRGTTVVLDAGHGGNDPGAQRGHLNEKDITLAITNKTHYYLKQKGVDCILTRHKDKTVSLQDRVKITNTKKPDLFLSVHVNSLETKSDIHGIETYYQTPQSLGLAKSIHKTLVEELDAPDRRVRKARFYVVNRTQVPAVLAEVGFISHKEERKKLATTKYQNQIAQALAKGVIQHLNKTTMIAGSEKDAKNLSNKSVTSGSKLAKTQGQTQSKQGTISRVSRLAQKGLGITVK